MAMTRAALSLVSLKKVVRYPSFILAFAKGARLPELAKLHASMEVTRTRKLFGKVVGEIPEDEVLSVMSYLAKHCWNNCYTNGYLYGICRWYRPGVVVETGVHYGASTWFILSALDDNETGKLYSIDAPSRTYSIPERTHSDLLPMGCEPGFIIPKSLKSRWSLILGTSRDKLSLLLHQLECVDIFHHDSEHTYETMTYEYKTVWPYLRQGGLLLSDDVLWNEAFLDFCRTVNCKYTIFRDKGFAYKL